MSKPTYIITSEDGRGLFYSTRVGRSRAYRHHLDKPQRGFKLFTFKRRKNAEALCDGVNAYYNDSFKVREAQ